MFTGASCTEEPAADCLARYSMTVRAYTAHGDDITHEVEYVKLYVFDSDGFFVKAIETTMGATVELSLPRGNDYTVVAWAEADGTGELFPALVAGEHHIGNSMVGLVPSSRSGMTVHDSPGDLFHGVATISHTAADNLIQVYRRVGSMNITVRRLREFTQSTDDDFSVVVHKTHSFIRFDDGSLHGDITAGYSPAGAFDAAGLYSTGVFNMLPSSDGISIELYQGNDLLRTVSTYSGGPITVEAGITTNVLIDFTTSLNVQVTFTDWGTAEIWKEF